MVPVGLLEIQTRNLGISVLGLAPRVTSYVALRQDIYSFKASGSHAKKMLRLD